MIVAKITKSTKKTTTNATVTATKNSRSNNTDYSVFTEHNVDHD